jgi:hypothetical protein
MNASRIVRFSPAIIGLAAVAMLLGCDTFNGPPSPYGYGGYGAPPPPPPYYGDYERQREWEHQRHEQHELNEEREHLDEERRQLDAQRNQPPPPPPHQSQTLHCPPGTHPSTHRCTNEERKRGCKDYGAANGQGCSNF